MPEFLKNQDTIIFQEMMSHPALFFHSQPKKIAVIGDSSTGIVQEILKHETVTDLWEVVRQRSGISDERVRSLDPDQWLATIPPHFFDVIVVNQASSEYESYFHALHDDGILVQLCESPFQTNILKPIQDSLLSTGFHDVLTLSFSQPHYPTGLRSAFLAKKTGVFKKIREKDIYNKPFTTHYYNFDIHKASLVMPEFMRTELAY